MKLCQEEMEQDLQVKDLEPEEDWAEEEEEVEWGVRAWGQVDNAYVPIAALRLITKLGSHA